MKHNILLTGASGYLGGSLLAQWSSANLPQYGTLFALVRTDEQAKAVQEYGATPLQIDVSDAEAIAHSVSENQITVVLYLIDALNSEVQLKFIKALAEVKRTSGQDVHFVHTSGAKIFSSHAGAPTNKPLLDNASDLLEIQKSQVAPISLIQKAVATNTAIVESGQAHGVKTYIFVPCIVYGKGQGFGNGISIQTTAIVKAAKACKRVFSVDEGRPTWPVCHIDDNTTLYLQMLRRILEGASPPSGANGYYLAASGSVAWEEIYSAMAVALAKRGIVNDEDLARASNDDLTAMGKALDCPADFVPLQLGGLCTLTARRGAEIGWKPKHGPDHILAAADEEVDNILKNL